MRFSLLSIALFFSIQTLAQVQLSGTILDHTNGKGIEAVNVFIPYSNIGTITDAEGKFTITVPVGTYELVVSHIAYKTLVRKLSYVKPGEKSQTIRLVPAAVNIEEVTVSAKAGKKWRKSLKKFEKAFFGASENAAHCKILNPTVLHLENQSGKLIATATDLIEIENRGTGYKLYFLLEKFESDGPEITYAGKPFFKELEPADEAEAQKWAKQRKTTFAGSPVHFYRALLQHKLEDEGFELHTAKLQKDKSFLITGQPNLKTIVKDGKHTAEKLLDFNDFLRVVYTREEDQISIKNTNIGRAAKQLGRPAEREMMEQERRIRDFKRNQISYLFARKADIPIDTAGYLLRPELIVEYGYWNHERVADLLPRNYFQPKSTHQQTEESYPPLLGFKMNNLRIPYPEIKHGGPPKDGIPSIDNPKFITSNSPNAPQDQDVILGLVIGKLIKAYPLKILDKHEIVNDWFGEEPVVITYCPLCGSGAAFKSRIDGERRSFGVSGLLYNSDVLLYDRKTESLWSQIMGESISGEASGTRLEMIPIVQTTWKEWRSAHPETKVLSTETGFDRDYTAKSYEAYRKTDKLMFPVSKESDLFKNKEMVIGIEIDGQFKAYPFSKLEKAKQPLKDVFNTRKLEIRFNKGNQSAQIFNEKGELLPAMTLYWFAWYAFHPDTEVYQGD